MRWPPSTTTLTWSTTVRRRPRRSPSASVRPSSAHSPAPTTWCGRWRPDSGTGCGSNMCPAWAVATRSRWRWWGATRWADGYRLLTDCLSGRREPASVINTLEQGACAAWAGPASPPGASGAPCATSPLPGDPRPPGGLRLPLLWRRLPAHLRTDGGAHPTRAGPTGWPRQPGPALRQGPLRPGLRPPHPGRLTRPLIRRENAPKTLPEDFDPGDPLRYFRKADWDEALDRAADGLRRLRDRHGPRALAGFGSAKGSNEERLTDEGFIAERTEGFEVLSEVVMAGYSPEAMASVCGIHRATPGSQQFMGRPQAKAPAAHWGEWWHGITYVGLSSRTLRPAYRVCSDKCAGGRGNGGPGRT